uniref:Uncharacterized protein n=1 Tax=Candidatus Kentrum sp. FW TaxID=2126338 RepID=A0A450U4A2_9GAMM|nr:MAG: hypothetical protein BECKFW1821C_GA0114237_11674 [Candidatus Kentron sp. FW]
MRGPERIYSADIRICVTLGSKTDFPEPFRPRYFGNVEILQADKDK